MTPRCNVGHVIQGLRCPLSSVYVSNTVPRVISRAMYDRGRLFRNQSKTLSGTSFSSNMMSRLLSKNIEVAPVVEQNFIQYTKRTSRALRRRTTYKATE